MDGHDVSLMELFEGLDREEDLVADWVVLPQTVKPAVPARHVPEAQINFVRNG
jgi:hypothetical protein